MSARAWFASALVTVMSASGCTCGSESTARPPAPPPPSEAAPPVLGVPADVASRVVARIDEREVTVGDYAMELELDEGGNRARFLLPRDRPILLDHMIDERLLGDEAARRGWNDAPEVRRARDELLASALSDELLTSHEVPEPTLAEQRAFYDSHASLFHTPEMARARLMYVRDRARALAVIERLRRARHWEDEWEVAADREAFRGPRRMPTEEIEITRAPREGEPVVPPEIRTVIFESDSATYYPEPIPALDGFYLVWIVLRLPATERSFDDVRESIRTRLAEEAQRRAIDELTAPFVRDVELHEDVLDALVLDRER